MPNTAKNLPNMSKKLSRLTADRMPNGTPTPMVNKMAAPASCRGAGRRSNSMSPRWTSSHPGLAKVTPREVLHKEPVLHWQGFVEPQVFLELFVVRLGTLRAQKVFAWIAGKVNTEEDGQAKGPQGEDCLD